MDLLFNPNEVRHVRVLIDRMEEGRQPSIRIDRVELDRGVFDEEDALFVGGIWSDANQVVSTPEHGMTNELHHYARPNEELPADDHASVSS